MKILAGIGVLALFGVGLLGCVGDASDDADDAAASEEAVGENLLMYSGFEYSGEGLPSAWKLDDSSPSSAKIVAGRGYKGSLGLVVTDSGKAGSNVVVSQTVKAGGFERFVLQARSETNEAAVQPNGFSGSTQRLILRFLGADKHPLGALHAVDPPDSAGFKLAKIGGSEGILAPPGTAFVRVEIRGSATAQTGESRIWDNVVLGGKQQTIAGAVAQLKKAFPNGMDTKTSVTSTAPLGMVKNFVKKEFADYPQTVAKYKYVQNAGAFQTDVFVAGTNSAAVATAEVKSDVKVLWNLDQKGEAAAMGKALSAMEALGKVGASFGFDGSQENGCGAPPPYLLILDPKDKLVHGIDLAPCSE